MYNYNQCYPYFSRHYMHAHTQKHTHMPLQLQKRSYIIHWRRKILGVGGGALYIIKDHTHFPTNIINIVIYNRNTMLFILCSFRYQFLYVYSCYYNKHWYGSGRGGALPPLQAKWGAHAPGALLLPPPMIIGSVMWMVMCIGVVPKAH